MTASPDVRVFQLHDDLKEDDVLVIASDGLWEKLTNETVSDILKSKLSMQKPSESRRYIVAAQGLVDEARGFFGERGWRMLDNKNGSYDDISVFVIPLANWRAGLSLTLQKNKSENCVDDFVSNSNDESSKDDLDISPVGFIETEIKKQHLEIDSNSEGVKISTQFLRI